MNKLLKAIQNAGFTTMTIIIEPDMTEVYASTEDVDWDYDYKEPQFCRKCDGLLWMRHDGTYESAHDGSVKIDCPHVYVVEGVNLLDALTGLKEKISNE